MSALQATAQRVGAAGNWADLSFRLARMFILTMLVIMPMEAITAAREVGLVGAALMLGLHLYLSGDFEFRPTPLLLPLAFYAACAAASLFTAVDFAYTLKEVRAEVLKGAIIFYSGVYFIRDMGHLRQCWNMLLVGAAIMGVAGLALFFLYGGSIFHHFVRAGSLHNGYGSFSTYLVTVWPFILLAPKGLDLGPWRRWWPVLVGVTALSAYVTYSRTCWAALVLESGLCLLVVGHHRLRAAAVTSAVCVMLIAVLFALPGSGHGERWARLWTDPQKVGGSAGDLMSLWRFSFKEITEHPFRGIGLGRHSFSKAFPEFRATHQPLLWHAHNMFVDLTLQLGVQGLVGILLVLAVLVGSLWPRSPPSGGDAAAWYGAATAIMVVGFAARNLTDDFFVDDKGLMFWLLAGLAMGARTLARQSLGSAGER